MATATFAQPAQHRRNICTMAWRPILDGELAVRSRAAAAALVAPLADRAIEPADLGAATLFAAYAAGSLDQPGLDDTYARLVDQLVVRLDGEYQDDGLLGGLAGDACVISHVVSEGADDLLATVDDILLARLAAPRPLRLTDGLLGLARYFIDRAATTLPHVRELACTAIARIGERIEGDHLPAPHGCTWQTTAEGAIELGVARGVAGVIGTLDRIATVLDAARLRHLCSRGARWLWAQQLPYNRRNRFPAQVGDGPLAPARTSWCTGDLGITSVLWGIAVHSGSSPRAALELAREIAVRDFPASGAEGLGVCHGIFGYAHILGRFYQRSGDDLFRRSAIELFERGLDELERQRPRSCSLLDGISGIGLALLAATSDTEPAWDRWLLVDLPPHSP